MSILMLLLLLWPYGYGRDLPGLQRWSMHQKSGSGGSARQAARASDYGRIVTQGWGQFNVTGAMAVLLAMAEAFLVCRARIPRRLEAASWIAGFVGSLRRSKLRLYNVSVLLSG